MQVDKTDNTERCTRHWSRRNHRVTDTFRILNFGTRKPSKWD